MSRMSELDQIIKDLRSCADTLIGVIACLEALPKEEEGWTVPEEVPFDEGAAPAQEAPCKQEEPLAFEDVQAALADLSRKGYTRQIRELICGYGVQKLSEVDASHYRQLLKKAEELAHG